MTKYGMLALLALVAGYVGLFALVAEQVRVSTWAIVALFIILLLPFVAIAVGLFWLQGRTQRPQPRREEQPRDVIDGNWHQVEQPQPQAQLPAPYIIQPAPRTTVPVTMFNGKLPGQRAAEMILTTPIIDENGKSAEAECSVKVLRVAADILASGKQPTRQSFNDAGIMSSTEVKGACSYLRVHGWVAPGEKGTPARWADGLTAEHAPQLTQWLDTYADAHAK